MPNNKPNKIKNNFCEKRLPELIEREKVRTVILESMKKESETESLKQCTFTPNLSKKKLNVKYMDTRPETEPNIPIRDKNEPKVVILLNLFIIYA